jgi:O-antigen/teichoic acid export membrane protein
MELAPQPVAKNTIWLSLALVLQKVISFLFFLYVARRLGSLGTGQYVAAFSFSTMFAVFLDLGFSSVVTRDVARTNARSSSILGTALFVKMAAAVVVYPALVSFVWLLEISGVGHPPLGIIVIAGLIMVVDSLTLTATSVLRGWQNLSYESVAVILNKLTVIIFGGLIVWLWPQPQAVAAAILIGSLVSLLFASVAIGRHWSYERLRRPTLSEVKIFSRQSWPFAVAAIFFTAYGQIDSIILSILKGNQAVGLYSVASKAMNAFAFLPSAFSAALFPTMSADFAVRGERLEWLLEESLRYLLIISAPLAVGSYIYADFFVGLIGEDYGPAAAAVRILMPSLILVFLSFPIGAILNATNHQNWQTAVITSATILNIVINIILIPQLSYIGASFAWLITNVYVIVLGFILIKRFFHFKLRAFAWALVRVGFASGALLLVTINLRPITPLLINISLSGVTYLAVLWVTREITLKEVRQLWSLFRRPASLPVPDAQL